MTFLEFQQQFSDEAACRAHLEVVRWPDGPVCPKCGAVGRAGRIKTRPGLWNCYACRRSQFSVTAGTAMHRSKVPLTKWFLAIWLIATSSKGVSGMKLAEWLGVDYRTAWYMGHRVRAMMADPDLGRLRGIVEADEMYHGGRKKPEDDDPGPGTGGSRRGRGHGRTPILIATERNGSVRAKGIATHSSAEIGMALWRWLDRRAELVTDGLPAYRGIGRVQRAHRVVDHGRRTFSDGAGVHVNTAEGFIGLFRRAVQGTWHHVSSKHVDRYLTEVTWRHNRRDVSLTERFDAVLVSGAGPLGYGRLVA
jgi:ribosomal protein L37AE/L43A